MSDVVNFFLAFHEHIIDVNLHCFSDFFSEHTVYEALVSCSRIPKSEGHHFEIVDAFSSYERCFGNIIARHLYLVEPLKRVHKTQ